ncbi:MAG: ADP-ribose pyrophosphatase [Candidatus Colwellbacteria bacterium CG10_big_fil_rev_8_21_14_0_10_42_22]|uniref:ADP-ribose pyrophosphatase n=1 Tax=Candidatus Colwellbacteria bacterium CG10_big_fil_rev_8_21_14_0_10_42_22 TaxID=1974540 RepID=A0A2H0VHX3_9BACT|nr:MAG: ADP-ribose pyrophosphatase [Candidatus Colwellbacteria bacterium CG10_big_fil_rev_8_21_14_0_10_42_22]
MIEWKLYLAKLLGKKRHTAYVLLEKEGKFLLVQESTSGIRGLWGLPGGGIDGGESPEQAAEREVEEESGFDVELIRKIAEIQDKKRNSVRHIFLGKIKSGELRIDKREHIDAGWFSKEEMQSLKLRGDWVIEAFDLI